MTGYATFTDFGVITLFLSRAEAERAVDFTVGDGGIGRVNALDHVSGDQSGVKFTPVDRSYDQLHAAIQADEYDLAEPD